MDNELEIPSKEDFLQWLAEPMTRWLLRQWLPLQIQNIKDQWAAGVFATESQSGTIQLNAEAIARVTALQQLSELDYETIQGEFDARNK